MLKSLLVGSGAAFVLNLGTLVVLARVLPLDAVATIKEMTLYGGTIALLASLQIHSGVVFHRDRLARGRDYDDRVIYTCLTLALLGAGCFIVLGLTGLLRASRSAAMLYSVWVFGQVLMVMTPAIFASFNRHRAYPRFSLAMGAANMAAVVGSTVGDFSVEHYSLLLAVGVFGAISLSAWTGLFRSHVLGRPPRWLRGETMLYSLRVFRCNLVESLTHRVDKFAASILLTTPQFGRYSVLCFENPLVDLTLSSIGVALVKQSSVIYRDTRSHFLSIWRAHVELSSAIIVFSSSFALLNCTALTELLFGDRYADSSWILAVYMATSLTRYAPFQVLLRLEDRVNLTFWCAASALAVALVVAFGVALVSIQPEIALATSYLSGWLTFNTTVVLVYGRVGRYALLQVVLVSLPLRRFAQAAAALAVAEVISARLGTGVITRAGLYFLALAAVLLFTDRALVQRAFARKGEPPCSMPSP